MLKTKITKADFDALPDALKAYYKQDGDNYLLQSDDAAELRAAKERESAARIAAEAEAKRLKDEAAAAETARLKAEQDAADEKARKSGDIAALDKSWQAKLDDAVRVERERADKLEKQLRSALVDGKAEALAAEISTTPELLAPLIAARLDPDLTGEKAIVRIKDANGQPSAANLDDLKKEFVANAKFAAIIKGSNASGGGANGNNSGGGAANKKISEMTEAEKVAYHRANPEAYKAQARQEGLPVFG